LGKIEGKTKKNTFYSTKLVSMDVNHTRLASKEPCLEVTLDSQISTYTFITLMDQPTPISKY